MPRKTYATLERKVCDRIKAARLELGWSQGYLAKRVGVQRPRITQMETHSYPGMTIRTLFSIAEALGENPEDLLIGKLVVVPLFEQAGKGATKRRQK